MAFGAGAAMVMGALGVWGGLGVGTGTAAAEPSYPAAVSHYVQPHPGHMNMGQTATFEAPPTTPAIASAAPGIRAGG